MQMPFGIREQIDRIRTYAAQAKAEAHNDDTRALVSNLDEAADNLETMARIVFGPLDPDFPPPFPPAEPSSRET
jgi:hypothetical protein